MKVLLDTSSKTIQIEESVSLSKLYDWLETILPNGVWKEYELIPKLIISEWTNPFPVIPNSPYEPSKDPYTPDYPWIVTCGVDTHNADLLSGDIKAGQFNIEIRG